MKYKRTRRQLGVQVAMPKRVNFKGDSSECAYLVVQQYSDGQWGFADCWDVPYVFKYYKDALSVKKAIEKKQRDHSWKSGSTAIIKIEL